MHHLTNFFDVCSYLFQSPSFSSHSYPAKYICQYGPLPPAAKIDFNNKYNTKETMAAHSGVVAQANTMSLDVRRLRAALPCTKPTPKMAPITAWVVDTGMPKMV